MTDREDLFGPDRLGLGDPVLVTRRQLAEIVGRTTRTIQNWDKSVPLKPIRIGRSVFYAKKETFRRLGIAPDDGS